MAKVTIKAIARDALKADVAARKAAFNPMPDGTQTKGVSHDSFQNFAHKLGVGADNPLSTASYGFNPISRNHIMVEWMYRGSWIAGVVVDSIADDATREGVDYKTDMKPEDTETIDAAFTGMHLWTRINECMKWARLYGGCIGVVLIDGQDMRTPLRPEAVGEGQFKGMITLDRWMVDPDTSDLVTDLGPHLGMPKYYRVGANAPALRGQVIHYSRVAFRLLGVKLPYQQSLTENLWGISVYERLFDRMIAFDSASTGAAQLIYKSYLRTLKIKGMREVVSIGGPAMDGLVKYTDLMRKFQGMEGITLIDGEDEFEAQTHGAFSGISDVLTQFATQLSGASQIPLTRLFGQSPGGLNATGESDMRNYYDKVHQLQDSDLLEGVTMLKRLTAQSLGIKVPDDFGITFRSLWQLSDKEKSDIAKQTTDTIMAVKDSGVISDQVVLQELRQLAFMTGVWTNVTTELIDAAETELPPQGEGIFDPATGEQKIDPLTGKPVEKANDPEANGPKKPKDSVAPSKERRKPVQR